MLSVSLTISEKPPSIERYESERGSVQDEMREGRGIVENV